MADDRGPALNRRELLAAGTAALASTAGCALDDDVSGSPTTSDHGAPFAYPLRAPHETTQFNPWLSGYPHDVQPLFYAYRSVYRHGRGRRFEHLVDSVAIDGSTATVRYSDEYRWWNGEPVTARDDYVRLRLQELVREHRRNTKAGQRGGRSAAGFDFEVEQVDEYALEYEFAEALNPRLVRDVVAGGAVTTAARLFEEWVERFESASTADERSAVMTEFRERTIPFEEMMDRGFGCGPFEPTALLEPRVECELFEQHPDADDIGIERVHLPVARGVRDRQMLLQGDLDAGQRTLSDLGSAVPSFVEQLDRYRLDSGLKLLCHWRGPLADRRVRWALAAAIPFEDLAENSQLGEPVRRQTGMGTPAEERWLSDTTRDRLWDHPTSAAPERAAEYLRAAGFERSGDHWRDANGDPIEFRFQIPTFETWTAAARTIGESLRSLGIRVRITPAELGTFFSNVTDGIYDIALWWHAGGPFDVYDVTASDRHRLGYGVDDSSRETSPRGKPVAPRVPERVSGPENSSGDRLDLVSQWEALRSAPTDARVREAVDPFARWWNFDLPDVQLVDDVAAIWGNTRDYAWPASGDPALRTYGPSNRPELHALVTGAVDRRS